MGFTKLSPPHKKICLLTLLVLLGFNTNAFSGPVERELISRGSNVSIPAPRPTVSKHSDENLNPTAGQTADETNKSTEPEAIKQIGMRIPEFDESCFSRLSRIAVIDRAIQPDSNDDQCVIPTPIILKETRSPSPMAFTNGLLLDCGFAEALVKFLSTDLQQAALDHIHSPLTKIKSGQGFICRRRNNLPTGKLSEHAFGNALDFISFDFANDISIGVRSAEEMPAAQAQFFTRIRKAACSSFTTVLGPGTNATHATHLHVDLGRSKGSSNPYRICE